MPVWRAPPTPRFTGRTITLAPASRVTRRVRSREPSSITTTSKPGASRASSASVTGRLSSSLWAGTMTSGRTSAPLHRGEGFRPARAHGPREAKPGRDDPVAHTAQPRTVDVHAGGEREIILGHEIGDEHGDEEERRPDDDGEDGGHPARRLQACEGARSEHRENDEHAGLGHDGGAARALAQLAREKPERCGETEAGAEHG